MNDYDKNYQLLIVGAGPVGCVMAERAANLLGWKVLIVEKRSHIGGNCYDMFHESGVLIHRYGPHYFRTNNEDLLKYLSSFTEWVPGNYYVKIDTNNQLYPFPINLLTLRQFFNKPDMTEEDAARLLEEKREKIEHPTNSEEFVLSRVGRELYEAFYLGYTLKQWAIHPRDLATSVAGRIPVRLNTDERYVDHKYQYTPARGFTEMFRKMTEHPNIDIRLETDYKDIKDSISPLVTLYAGPIDEYFGHCYGKLPWRSLDFEFKTVDREYTQPCVQINYPNDHDYTRTVEIKHVTGQQHAQTVVSYEYPKAEGDPYYPIPRDVNKELYEKYKDLAIKETEVNDVYFCGRLAEYKYYNTDEVIERALATFNIIKDKYDNR